MTKRKHLHAFMALAVGCMLMSCHSDVDLKNVDTTAQLDLGMAMPVGTLNLTVGDFIGDVQNLYVDTTGVLTYQIDTTISRYYHQVDLKEHISSKELNLDVYKQAQAKGLIGPNNKVTGNGMPVTLDFPMTLKLKDINSASTVAGERLDSAYIELASFSSKIDTVGASIKWEWIDKITLDLGPQINRAQGNTMVVYDKNRDTDPTKYNYNVTVPTKVDDFSIVLMKNRKPASIEQYLNNVIDTCDFYVHFTFTIPDGVEVYVPENSAFNYLLGVQFIDYKAIWGMFQPSSDMHDEAVVDLSESWGALDFLKRAKVPFSDPIVDVNIGTQVAGALYIDSAYVFGIDKDGVRTDATFEGGKTYRRVLFEEGEWLPLSSAIGDSTTNMNVRFDKTERGGQIHRLFRNVPQELGYKFAVKFDMTQTPQIRVTNNTAINVKSTATLPFMFNNGLYIDYSDTLRDINLSKFSIDSLLAEVKALDSLKVNELRLVLKAENNIPLCVKAYMRCLDESGNIIKDPEDASKPLLLFESDTVHLVAPTYANNGGWYKAAPGETVISAYLTQPKIDLLPQIKQIVYTVVIDDESLQDAYSKGLGKIRIESKDQLKLTIGLSGNVDATFNFNNNNSNQTN